MDDDAPLSALAKPKAKTSDDDLPLAALNKSSGAEKKSKGKGKGAPAKPAQAGAKPAGAAGAAGAAKGAAKGKKKRRSSSSSYSSSYSDSSSSSGPKKGKVRKKKKLTGEKPGADENQPESGAAFKKKQRTATDEVVAELLCRWWYVLPDWPPNDDEYYAAELGKRNLRKVRIEEWEWVPEEDSSGRKKCYELSQFRGLFRNSAGELIDCRPQETCPCWANFSKKDIGDLYDLLVKAYEGQLKALEASVYDEKKHMEEVKRQLNKARTKASEVKQLGYKRK